MGASRPGRFGIVRVSSGQMSFRHVGRHSPLSRQDLGQDSGATGYTSRAPVDEAARAACGVSCLHSLDALEVQSQIAIPRRPS